MVVLVEMHMLRAADGGGLDDSFGWEMIQAD